MTLNVDQVLLLRRDSLLAVAYEQASVRTIDGTPLLWLAKLVGSRRATRNTGADLIYSVSEHSAGAGWRVGVAGGRAGAAMRAAENLSQAYPNSQILGIEFPEIAGPADNASVHFIDHLCSLNIDVLFLCLGCPKQETWFHHWRNALPPGVYVGAGAAVDFASGSVARAPQLVQRIGLEWLWRLCQDPKRLARRYLIRGPRFLGVVVNSITQNFRRIQ
ncbi:WecB/TagA/CpsF family glycosyltransferase [Rhodococcoides fascians]|uniref:WecB/TagA/CpsF family glycosyltransferase n=1 Tax=Rhodococcoides fascians TaxID=1828 RepID=UPI0035304E33